MWASAPTKALHEVQWAGRGVRPHGWVTKAAAGYWVGDRESRPYSFLPAFPLREKFVLLFSAACGTMRLGILYAKKYALHPGRPERQQEV